MVETKTIYQQKKLTLLTLTLSIFIAGCVPKSKIAVNIPKLSITDLSISITSVKVVNHQIVITGTNLNTVTNFKIREGATNNVLQIESKNKTSLVANTISNVTFAAGRVFDFILSNAHADATFTVDFSLCDSTLGGKSIACNIAPTDKQVLSYDAATGKWRPRSVNGLGYKGVWGTLPALPAVGALVPGDYYIINVAHGTYNVGDWIVLNDDGVTFEQVENSTQVLSVFGRTGAIVAAENDYHLDLMGDVDLTTSPPIVGDGLVYNGVKWVAGPVTSAGATGAAGGDLSGTYPNPTIGNNKITDAHIANAAISQTKINGLATSLATKEPTITAAATTTYFRGDKTFVTLNTTVVPEGTNLYFTNARALGVPLTGFNNALTGQVAATDSVLQAFGRVQNQINSLSSGGSNYLIKNGPDTLSGAISLTNVITATGAGDIVVNSVPLTITSAVNKTYADGKLDKTAGGTVAGVVTLDNDLKIKGGSNYVTIKGHATSANYNLILPSTAGTAGYVLSTDGSGNTSWITAAGGGAPTGTAGGDLSGTYPNPTITALDAAKVGGGAVSNTEFSYLDGVTSSIQTQLAAKEPAITAAATTTYLRGDKTFVTLNSTVVTEGTNLYFTNARALGLLLTGFDNTLTGQVAATDSMLQAFGRVQNQINSLTSGGTNYLIKNAPDTISGAITLTSVISATSTGDLLVNSVPLTITSAVNKTYADGKLDKTAGGTVAGVVTLDNDLKIKGGSNYVTIKGHATSANYNFILPSSAGTAGYVLSTDGSGNTSWIAAAGGGAPTGTAGGDLSGTYPNPTITALDAAKIGGGAVSNTEFSYLDGVTSSIQTQLNAKLSAETDPSVTAFAKAALPTCTAGQVLKGDGTSLTCVADNAGAGAYTGGNNFVVVTDGSGALSDSTITTTKLGYLSGVTSDVQTQLNAKQDTISKTTTQDVSKIRIYGANATNYVELTAATLTGNRSLIFPDSNGTTGQALTTNGSGVLSWTTVSGGGAPTGAAGGDLSGTYPNPTITALDAAKVGGGTVSNAEFSYVDGVTSSIQTQLDAKEPAITAAATTTYLRGDKTFVTLNTSVVPEGTNLYFTNARALGLILTGFDNTLTGQVAATDTMLQAFGRVQNQINSLSSGGSNYLIKNGPDTLSGAISLTNVITATGAGDIVVNSVPLTITSAVNKTYADGKLDKTTGGTVAGVVTLDNDLKIKGGTNYVTIKGHATSANYNLVLPSSAGTAGYVLSTDGSGNTSWITAAGGGAPTGAAGGDLSGTYPNPTITALDAAKVGGGAVSNTEFSYLDGVTSSIQTQLNAKLSAETDPSVTAFAKAALPTCTAGQVLKGDGTSLTCVSDNAGAGAYTGGNNFVVVTDGSGALSDSTITTTKLGYLSGVTSDVQTQLNAKQDTISKTTTQDVSKIRIYGANATNYVELTAATLTGNRSLIFPDSNGTTGQALTTNGSGVLSWTTVSGGGAPTGAAGGDLSGTYPNPTITALDAAKVGGGAVSNTEYSYLDGVTSSIQTQLTGKEPAITAGTTAEYLRGDKSLATFATDVRATTLTGLSSTAGTIAAGDTVLAAFGKMLNTQSDYVSKSGSTTVTGSFNIVGITAFLNIPTPTGTTLTEAANVDYVKTYVDAYGQWTKSGSDSYRSGGNVSIGSTPVTNTKLNVEGQIRSKSFSGTTGAIDWVNGNSGTTSFNCGSNLTFANLRDGGSYILAVTSTATTQCSFSTTTTGDDAGTVSYRFIPANAVRTASSHTIYSLQRIGSVVYVSWITGF